MSRASVLVYDDATEVPSDIFALVGIERFGALMHERRRVADHVVSAAERAGYSRVISLSDASERASLIDDAGFAAARVVYATSDVVALPWEAFARHLERLSFVETDLWMLPTGSGRTSVFASLGPRTCRSLLACRSEAQRQAWLREHRLDAQVVQEPDLLSLSDADRLVRVLSASFHTRAFNRIQADRQTVRKRSVDRDKMRREHDYWYLLPPGLQRFVVQPYDFREDGEGASYEMERLLIPDFSVLWIQGTEAVDEESFEVLLKALSGWFSSRGCREVSTSEARMRAESLYVDKVRARLAELLKTDVGREVDVRIQTGTRFSKGLSEVVALYEQRLQASWRARPPTGALTIQHGDLCFSNILFDKRSGLLRLIDPRGAASEDEIWGDRCYDLAKLSHSVIGGYDFIHHERFEIVVDDDLRLGLRLLRERREDLEGRFQDWVRERDVDPTQLRLYEASLFLSMLPLHLDHPRKVLAFALRAIEILDGS